MNWMNVKFPLRERRKKFLIVGLSREEIHDYLSIIMHEIGGKE